MVRREVRKIALLDAADDVDAFTVEQFCRRHGFSKQAIVLQIPQRNACHVSRRRARVDQSRVRFGVASSA